ncbi:1,3-beta-glucanosyltransferase gel1 [Fulvia fulva]|uniref:1,3-beta-glucanosyltransferase n=1 Tax=Passalora fulva TaxID=5499 RepID=A0A9Q8UQH2_PASFU|nr:1,3-beta-glucanosyltransferase gel1 [Fulvia fulva]KAK4621338.1 1,3-beta-glucanosyltransferase gel1 [Fulvia fulva]KAK4622720.1 1,3-beta-glucanosyltransferase gel1 [Fulvia fulva]UJO18715.1 1,3-beta-glucanosyltransferase gel1 [Fulvia fulva]WPV16667.1 1,3-beta-glucanosyltransferase gel1 [Fulvia fulva]WPV31132.1 1,3-beta-glucanosyltransferase gel1 [Fulvia fulva]
MSELQYYLRPRPAYEPVRTEGDVFWRDGDRFLIKGINYFIRHPKPPGEPLYPIHKVDCLSEEHLETLQRDVKVFRELGLNTIFIPSLDPTKNHHEALKLLAQAGIYVLVTIGEGIARPPQPDAGWPSFDTDFDTRTYHTTESLERSIRIVDELASYPNVLGFIVDGSALVDLKATKIAEVHRAHVRDIKSFLHLRGGRQIPVGVALCEILNFQLQAVQYFSAGPSTDLSCADFIARENWSWACKSDFRISGWKNMVKILQEYPIPMFLGEYGTFVGYRLWEEVPCLYSRDMTGVFSGGCLYTYCDDGSKYGIVEEDEGGGITRKPEFELLRKHFRTVNCRMPEELYDSHVKDYESWTGEFPERDEHCWFATRDLPECPVDLERFMLELRQEKEWEVISHRTEGLKLWNRDCTVYNALYKE